jgi:hypothetical protein
MMNLVHVYFYLGLFSTLLFILKMVLVFFGSDSSDDFSDDLSGDLSDDLAVDHSISGLDSVMKLISVQFLLAAGMGIGWLGYLILDRQFFSRGQAAFLSSFFGILMGSLSVFLLKKVKTLNSHPKKMTPQIGDVVEAYTHILAQQKGVGKVKFQTAHRIEYFPAMALDETISAFQPAIVTDVLQDGVLIVKRKK